MTVKSLFKTILFGIMLMTFAPALRSGSIGSGRTTCPSSGSLALSATSTYAAWVIIQPPSANGGIVYVGQSGVTSTTGAAILAGGSIMLPSRGNASPYNLNSIFFACGTNTDVVVYVYAQ